jgi:hypothetical protein
MGTDACQLTDYQLLLIHGQPACWSYITMPSWLQYDADLCCSGTTPPNCNSSAALTSSNQRVQTNMLGRQAAGISAANKHLQQAAD